MEPIKKKPEPKPMAQQVKGRKEKDEEIESLLNSHRTRIKVVGCGGAGNNTLSRLVEVGVAGVVAVAVNTDAQDLLYAQADEKILIGRDITNGLGAGSIPEIGEKSARESEEEIIDHLEQSDLVFVTCGLGGGTGTGSAPIVAEIARNLGALTIAVVTLPFTEEGVMRWENARQGLESLRANSDTVIVVQNDKLLEIAPDMPLNQAFKVADEILANAVKGITELVTEKGLVNLDFADIRAVMKNGGTAMIGLGESSSEEKAIEAVEIAVQNPLLDVDITGAKSALINITGGNDMSLKDARVIMKAVAEKLDPAARVIWGARMDSAMEQTLRVMLIVTGLRDETSLPMAPASQFMSYRNGGNRNKEGNPDFPSAYGSSLKGEFQASENKFAGKNTDQGGERPVFNKIFEEETEADLRILNEAVNSLKDTGNNDGPLRDIRNALSALNNSAQLFAFNHISYLAETVETVTASLVKGDIRLTRDIVELLKDVVVVFQGMVYEDDDAIAEAKKLIEKMKSLAGDGEAGKQNQEQNGDEWPISEEQPLLMPEGGNDVAEEENDDTEMGKKRKVGEMVNYVQNLLSEEPDQSED